MTTNDTNTRARRDAERAFKPVSRTEPMTDYEKGQQSFQDNRERLKAERLARQAAAESATD